MRQATIDKMAFLFIKCIILIEIKALYCEINTSMLLSKANNRQPLPQILYTVLSAICLFIYQQLIV